MSKSVQKISIDVSNAGVYTPRVFAKSNDAGSRFIKVAMMENGEPLKIPIDYKIRANIQKSDGKHAYINCTNDENIITVPLSSQALASPGTAICDVSVLKDIHVLTSASFYIDVDKSVYDENAVESMDEYEELTRIVKEAKTDKHETLQAKNKAETMRDEAKAFRDDAQASKATAETHAISASNSKTAAEKAEANAQASEEDARASANKAETMRDETEALRDDAQRYAGAVAYNLMLDDDGYICLNYKED